MIKETGLKPLQVFVRERLGEGPGDVVVEARAKLHEIGGPNSVSLIEGAHFEVVGELVLEDVFDPHQPRVDVVVAEFQRSTVLMKPQEEAEVFIGFRRAGLGGSRPGRFDGPGLLLARFQGHAPLESVPVDLVEGLFDLGDRDRTGEFDEGMVGHRGFYTEHRTVLHRRARRVLRRHRQGLV